jgi:8-oxo-dGTP pyrophosphatase MutT (NUDIX family)
MRYGACLIIRNGEGKYLLQMRDNTPGVTYPLHWDFFGGGIEEGETAAQAAAREMREEMGIEAVPEDFTEHAVWMNTVQDVQEHVMLYRHLMEWGDFRVFEGAGAGFFAASDIPALNATPPVRGMFEDGVLR